jgi:hypothetical protein
MPILYWPELNLEATLTVREVRKYSSALCLGDKGYLQFNN